MIKYCETQKSHDCCGCQACKDICPKNCISMEKDEEGYFYPTVKRRICINCGACARVCPMMRDEPKKNEYLKAYAGYMIDNQEVILNSSSGGIFPAIAKQILADGGIVAGAAFYDRFQLRHICIDKTEDLYKLQGSKYVQSNTEGIYKNVKRYLSEGKTVLFIGTPCHVYAMNNYLGKFYENLYTMDVICHGVPSQKMFDAYIDYLEKKHKGTLVDICFRDKQKYGWSITLRYEIEKRSKRKKYYLPRQLSPYFTGFLRGDILRESCYQCRFANMDRPGDLSLGDFWGYKRIMPELYNECGLSLIFSNTEKGLKLIEMLKRTNNFVQELEVDKAISGDNTNLFHPCVRQECRDMTYKALNSDGFAVMAKKYLKHPDETKEYIKAKLPVGILKMIRKYK